LLGFQVIETDKGAGNSRMAIKLWFFVLLAILLPGGIYLMGEMIYLFLKSRFRLAWMVFGFCEVNAFGSLALL